MSEAPAPKQIKNSMYDKMQFPKYEYREFPKAIPVLNGVVQDSPYNEKNKAHPVVIVKSQDELDALLSGGAKVVPVNPNARQEVERVESEDDVRERLYVRAEQLSVKVDKRWSVERIEKAIAEAEKPVL